MEPNLYCTFLHSHFYRLYIFTNLRYKDILKHPAHYTDYGANVNSIFNIEDIPDDIRHYNRSHFLTNVYKTSKTKVSKEVLPYTVKLYNVTIHNISNVYLQNAPNKKQNIAILLYFRIKYHFQKKKLYIWFAFTLQIARIFPPLKESRLSFK